MGAGQRLMQQALFSPGPSSCPAGPLPRVTALVRVLFCFCLDTLAKISVRAEGSDQVRRRLGAHPPHVHSACPFLNAGGFAGRKRSLGTWVPSTYMGGVGLRLSSLGVWPPGSFPKLQLTGVGVYEGGSEEAGGEPSEGMRNRLAWLRAGCLRSSHCPRKPQGSDGGAC